MEKSYVTKTENGYHLTGSRVSLDSIVYDWLSGLAPESIVANFPTLTLEQVNGAVAYYLVQRLLPVLDWHRPFSLDVFQGQVEQLEDRFIVRKEAPIFDDLAQRVVQRFNRVGRVDHPPDLCRELEERNDARPMIPPTAPDHWIAAAPLLLELCQRAFRHFRRRSRVDRFER